MNSLEENKGVYLLLCGIISPLIYFSTDIYAGLKYPGYSFTSQAISELFAIGAPTSSLVVPLYTLSSFFSLAFALGVYRSSGQNRSLRFIAAMFIGGAVNGLLLWNIFPMHMVGAETSFTDAMHIILAAVGVIFVLFVVCIVALTSHGWLRIYSLVTILVLLVPGAMVFLYIPDMALGKASPLIGLTERISTYGYYLWQIYYILFLIKTVKKA